jgi:inner membrane protein
LSLGAWFAAPGQSRVVLALGAACAVLPDLDVTGLLVGIGLDDPLGHRGFSHSLAFAALVATAAAWVVTRWRRPPTLGAGRVWLCLFLATASHGVLDAMTNGGRGVAFFSPLLDRRYHFGFRPIEVSPIGVREFFSERGLTIMANELVWIWLPALVCLAVALWFRRAATPAPLPVPDP